jgi:hypothetical protein
MTDTSRRSLIVSAAALPVFAVPALATAAMAAEPDPIFAAIEAHRAAFTVFSEANKIVDDVPVDESATCARAQVIIGYGYDTELIEGCDNEGPFWRWKRTGEKIPIYAYGTDEIERKVPKDLDDQAKKAWIDERTQELIKEEERAKSEYAKTDQGKLEAPSDVAAADDWYLLQELVETVPTTPGGLAALLAYVRTEQYVREQVFGIDEELTSLTNTYAWTMERLACAAAGLPEPVEHDATTEDDDA